METIGMKEDIDSTVERMDKIVESIARLSIDMEGAQRNKNLTYFDNITNQQRSDLKARIRELVEILEGLGASKTSIADFFGVGHTTVQLYWIGQGTSLPQRFTWKNLILPKIRDGNHVRTFVEKWM